MIAIACECKQMHSHSKVDYIYAALRGNTKNVAWKIDVPGRGWSQPVV
ncbi:MAG: hypothetical protein ACK506_09340 [Pirellula sp.]